MSLISPSAHAFIESLFSRHGLFATAAERFEERIEQKEMARLILESYEKGKIGLIEAGTGIGKTFAYLAPAVFWALTQKEKTVIATHTIALQEQLLHKDIPLLLNAIGEELRVSLMKGMNNYLCLRKLEECQGQPYLFSTEQRQDLLNIERWAEKTTDGSQSSLPFPVVHQVWEKVSADGDSCSRVHCPHYKKCFFFLARKEAEEAQLLVVNHHLLLTDVEFRCRQDGQGGILPSYRRLIIDEAHRLEGVALKILAKQLDCAALFRLFTRLHPEKHSQHSRLERLRKEVASFPSPPLSLLHKLEVELPAQKIRCQTALRELFEGLFHFFENAFVEETEKGRITEMVINCKRWQEKILPLMNLLKEEMNCLIVELGTIETALKLYRDLPEYHRLQVHLSEIQGICFKAQEVSQLLGEFSLNDSEEKKVRWFEKKEGNLCLIDASLNISKLLSEFLFSLQDTCILCSATMTTANSFSFIKERLGLTSLSGRIQEGIYESPFNYQERTLFAVPTDLPAPSSSQFLSKAVTIIQEIIHASQGSVFLLFTSYKMLNAVYEALPPDMATQYPFLKQGEISRHLLLEQFKRGKGSVLFATNSFWEGVDVPGDALRCVVIVKLPFIVPTDPLHEGYAEILEAQGINPFISYAIPKAVIKFKQGFGRLIRAKEDRGCVICLDNRMITREYGQEFLRSLPPCQTCFDSKEVVLSKVRQFLK